MKKALFFMAISMLVIAFQSCNKNSTIPESTEELTIRPEKKAKKERKVHNPDKNAIWTPEQAAHHQRVLEKLVETSKNFDSKGANIAYANGALAGEWVNRGPKNMPGAFKFAEMLDGTDIIYGVTLNHYVGEYNSKSYIHKGTVYNPNTGAGGDDFQLLTANWPNRYQNLFAFEHEGTIRLVAHIENGPLYYSDDDAVTWTLATGLPGANKSSAINRQEDHTIYVTDDISVYVSTDYGVSFSLLKDFSNSRSSFLYTPRYAIQDGADNVYLARGGSFYKLNVTGTDFDLKGSYSVNHSGNAFSIGGDQGTFYVTENKNYWVSTDEGISWTEKFPHGNWYGDTSGKMDAGLFFAAHPEDPNISLGGYAIPIISTDALDTNLTDEAGWGWYQNGTNLSAEDYYNRIRFNYHPDFQASHFFYNSSGDVFSARCSDGGIFISYKEWSDFPDPGVGYDNSGYANAHFINLNVLNTITPLVYRDCLFTGANNTDHINYGTQDQGSQSIIPGTDGDVLDFYQSIGGDGPPIDSYDGLNAWKWNRQGDKVWAPVEVYTSGGAFQSIGTINSRFNSSPTVDFPQNSDMNWVQTYIDHSAPDENIWILSRDLYRATWDNNNLIGHTVDKGENQVAALAQGNENPDLLYMLQDGKIFISTDRGNTFGDGINTPFVMTPGGFTRGDIGSGIVLPGNDNWVLFSGPSDNEVGSILSKDGGVSWDDVTGDFPAGDDAQTGGMIVIPNGELVFAGTDIGPYVFDVVQEVWSSIAEGIGFFNVMDVDYIQETNVVRFGSWGSGIIDFSIEPILGIQENSLANEITIYPNPSSDFVNVKLNTSETVKVIVDIFGINGQKINSVTHIFRNNIPLRINTEMLLSGMYLVRLTNSQQQVKTGKLIVK
jgi:hypothetical protein